MNTSNAFPAKKFRAAIERSRQKANLNQYSCWYQTLLMSQGYGGEESSVSGVSAGWVRRIVSSIEV